MDIQKEKIRSLVSSLYDIQHVRIATGNRIAASFRIAEMKEEQAARKAETAEAAQDIPDVASAEEKQNAGIMKDLKSDYELLEQYRKQNTTKTVRESTALKACAKDLKRIKTMVDYELTRSYMQLVEAEESFTNSINREVQSHPLWDAFFSHVKGCGPTMAAVCIAYFDPYKARHCSSFWKYAGLDVVHTAEFHGEGRNKKHTEMVKYIDKNGKEAEKKSLTYNPVLKSKLLGVLGGCFLKARGSEYAQIYYDYRNRQEQRNATAEEPIAAWLIHKRSLRYCVKMFVRDLWVAWRTLEGLPVSRPYEEVYLGHTPHKDPNLGEYAAQ